MCGCTADVSATSAVTCSCANNIADCVAVATVYGNNVSQYYGCLTFDFSVVDKAITFLQYSCHVNV